MCLVKKSTIQKWSAMLKYIHITTLTIKTRIHVLKRSAMLKLLRQKHQTISFI
jgi:hypothetical protein